MCGYPCFELGEVEEDALAGLAEQAGLCLYEHVGLGSHFIAVLAAQQAFQRVRVALVLKDLLENVDEEIPCIKLNFAPYQKFHSIFHGAFSCCLQYLCKRLLLVNFR